MKKTVLIFVFLVVIVSFLSATDYVDDIYFKNYFITKIYSHVSGYKINIMKSDMDRGVMYIPKKWFNVAGGKGEIIWGRGPEYPYLTIFWVEGEFGHIRLFLYEDMRHPSWAILFNEPGLEEKFDTDVPIIEF